MLRLYYFRLNQPRELSAHMYHVPLGFVMTGGVPDLETAESLVDGARDGIKRIYDINSPLSQISLQ